MKHDPARITTARPLATACSQGGGIFLPVYANRIPAGFPSPADDYLEGRLDIHALLVRRPAATFFARADGPSMKGLGIQDGDLLVVKQLLRQGERWVLAPANPDFPLLEIDPAEGIVVWGVVTASVTTHCHR